MLNGCPPASGAGTVEFLRDAEGHFHFMEMNARLQVEHPVTEMLTGVDLVAEQLAIAANRPLSFSQDEIRFDGHAIELRINAEDPDDGFRPDPGTITDFAPPTAQDDRVSVRWDSAITAGYRIPPHYDSMLGKLIVHAPDRQTAISGAVEALGTLQIGGVKTTAGLLSRVLDSREFRSGEYDVNFLEQSSLLRPTGS